MNILVSACLFGMNCKYDGGNNLSEKVRQLKDDHTLILVCPEQLGGLDTPRLPSEIQMESDQKNPRVIASDGEDVTEAFVRGAEIVEGLDRGGRTTKIKREQAGGKYKYTVLGADGNWFEPEERIWVVAMYALWQSSK